MADVGDTNPVDAGTHDPIPETVDISLWRELRIAPILTGGTSLAVWIGGVTAELYRLVNCRETPRRPADDVYRSLLELTKTRALVDVITGTSAGGLNGVLLSTAWALRVPTDLVLGQRDLWMELGSIEALLRSPNEKDPPSLLKGDDYFWPRLTQVVDDLARAGAATIGAEPGLDAPRPRPTNFALTVTTLSGELTRRVDDVGQELQETKQDHTIEFTTEDFGRRDDPWSRRLALAARTSSSLPAIFEPSYLPVGEAVGTRPEFGDRASFTVGRWAVDGGALANQPIGAARDRIIGQSVGAELRRVALFVNPTPSEGPPNVADDPKLMPKLLGVASKSFTAPRNIGIRHEVDDLRDYNQRVRRSVDVGRAVSRAVAASPFAAPSPDSEAGDPIARLAESLYDQFRRDRAVLSVSSMLDRVGTDLEEEHFPRRRVEDALVDAVHRTDEWLPRDFVLEVGPDWVWGIAPLEYNAGLLLELIRRTYQLPVGIVGDDHRLRLGQLRTEVHRTMAALTAVRAIDSAFWRAALSQRPEQLFQWAEHCYQAWPDPSLLAAVDGRVSDGNVSENGERNEMQTAVHLTLWEVAVELAGLAMRLRALVGELDLSADDADLAAEVADGIRAVSELVALLSDPVAETAGALRAVVQRFVALHVVAVSLGDTTRRHAEIELIEVSWRAENALDPSRLPEQKLAGVQFGRLGAFVKRSWRANDWMWGRMDAAGQLVRVLLDPRRLRQIGVEPGDVVARLEALDGVPLDPDERHDVEAELGFLLPQAHHLVPLPSSLPVTTDAFLRRAQLTIATEELPEVYFAVRRSLEEGAGEGDGGNFRRRYEHATAGGTVANLTGDEVASLFQECRIGSEDASDEVGKDLLTALAGRTAVVAANLVTGEQSGLTWPGRIARPFRQVALLTYAMTRAATTNSRTGMAVSATLAALAGSIVALFLLSGRTAVDINSGLVLLALIILGGGIFLAILRSGVWAASPGFLALLVVALALIGDGMGEIVIGTDGLDPDATWRDDVFLGPWPIVTLVVIAACVGWVASTVSRVGAAWRLERIDRERAAARGVPRPAMRLGPVVDLVTTGVFVPAVLVLHQPFVHFLLVGDDGGWRAWLVSVATWLGDRQVVMVIAGLVAFGIFFGLAWDRSVRRALVWVSRRARAITHQIVGARRGSPEAVPVRAVLAHPLEAIPQRVRRRLVLVFGAGAIVAFAIVAISSQAMATLGHSYVEMQASGGDLSEVLVDLAPDRSAVATALFADNVFAVLFASVLALVAGLISERFAARRHDAPDRSPAPEAGWAVGAWLALAYGIADLAENNTLIGAFWRVGQGDPDVDALGWLALGLGWLKWGCLIAIPIVVAVAWLSARRWNRSPT